MGWIQFVVILVGFLAFAIYLGSVFISTKWSVRRRVEIQAAPESIFPFAIDAIQKWKTDKMEGLLEVIESKPPQGVKYKLVVDGRWELEGILLIKPFQNGSEVFWECRGNSGRNPIRKYFNLMMDRWIGTDFQKELENLKVRVESKNESTN